MAVNYHRLSRVDEIQRGGGRCRARDGDSDRDLLAGGEASGVQFRDVALQPGIRAEMRCGGPEKRWIPEANGSGAAWLEYDNDGLMDLLIVNGSGMDDLRRIVGGAMPAPSRTGVYLFRNLGERGF